ncbi:MAG: hypothetical protein ABEJ92_06910 [Halobacteriales archaeon]
MPGRRARLVEPDAGTDVELTSRRGLLAGAFQAGLYVVAFGALFLLGLVLDLVSPDAVAAAPAAVGWAALLGGGAVGAGMVALATVEPVRRFWRRPVGRLATVLAVYLAFFGLVATLPGPAVVAGLAFVGGRLAAHAWLVATAP